MLHNFRTNDYIIILTFLYVEGNGELRFIVECHLDIIIQNWIDNVLC